MEYWKDNERKPSWKLFVNNCSMPAIVTEFINSVGMKMRLHCPRIDDTAHSRIWILKSSNPGQPSRPEQKQT